MVGAHGQCAVCSPQNEQQEIYQDEGPTTVTLQGDCPRNTKIFGDTRVTKLKYSVLPVVWEGFRREVSGFLRDGNMATKLRKP